MMWEIEWGPLAVDDVRRMHWLTAGRLCAAVIDFAKTSRGPVQRTNPRDPGRLELVVPGAVVYLALDFERGVVRVGRMFARA